jgi:hypothetical protein
MARFSTLTPELQSQIVQALARGDTRRATCASLGVSLGTLCGWLTRSAALKAAARIGAEGRQRELVAQAELLAADRRAKRSAAEAHRRAAKAAARPPAPVKTPKPEPKPRPAWRPEVDRRPIEPDESIAAAVLAGAEAAKAKVSQRPRLGLPPGWPAIRQAVHVLGARDRAAVMVQLLCELADREARDGELGGPRGDEVGGASHA